MQNNDGEEMDGRVSSLGHDDHLQDVFFLPRTFTPTTPPCA